MASKRPLRISDDPNDIVTQEFGDTDFARLGGLDLNNSLTQPSHLEGQVFYDKDHRALTVHNDEADIIHQLGREGLVRVYNNSGVTIIKGKAVYVTGNEATEFLPTVGLAKADAQATSKLIGITTHDIENNSFGYVMRWGLLEGLDTSSYSLGDSLFLSASTAGDLTSTEPAGGFLSIRIGYVIRSHASLGKILVLINGDLGASQFGDKNLSISFSDKNEPFIEFTSTTYVTAGSIIYEGSNDVGVPDDIKVISNRNGGSTYDVRVFDITNSLTIAQTTGQTNLTPQIVSLGSISNVPTAQAIWEFQVRAPNPGKIRLRSGKVGFNG